MSVTLGFGPLHLIHFRATGRTVKRERHPNAPARILAGGGSAWPENVRTRTEFGGECTHNLGENVRTAN